ncbi:MAG: hypothetical protein LBU23_03625 [Planctomycetota bacterium]|nr:hypothetical protein [Planctomycetota bacterium]
MNRPQFRAIEGTREYFGPEGDRFDKALSLAAELFRNYGYARVRTPVFESNTACFRLSASIGAANH